MFHAILLMHEVRHGTLRAGITPFVGIAMLEQSAPLEVMLAHGSWQRMDRSWDERKGVVELPKGQMKGVLVAVNQAIEEVRVLVEPKGQAQGVPAAPLVHQQLAAFKLPLCRAGDAEKTPDTLRRAGLIMIRPEDGARLEIVGVVEKKGGIPHHHIVRVQEEDLLKRGMEEGEGFQFPTAQPARRVEAPQLERIHAFHMIRAQKGFHARAHFLWTQVPELDGEGALELTEHADADPGVGEIADAARAKDDAAAGEGCMGRWDAFQKGFTGQADVGLGEGALIEGVAASETDALPGGGELCGLEVVEAAALVVGLDGADDIPRRDEVHAMREILPDIHAEVGGGVARIAIAERNRPVPPASSLDTTGQGANGVKELVAGIEFPMNRFTAAGQDNAWAECVRRVPDIDGRGQVHEAGDWAKDTLGVVDQPDQFPQAGLAAQIHDAAKPRVVMPLLTDLHEQDPILKMIHDLLEPIRTPPFDRGVVFAAGGDDPKRGVLAGDLVDLGIPGPFPG